jgi:hypothetical protein
MFDAVFVAHEHRIVNPAAGALWRQRRINDVVILAPVRGVL